MALAMGKLSLIIIFLLAWLFILRFAFNLTSMIKF